MNPMVCALNSGVSPLLPISSGISSSQRRIASFFYRSSWKPLPNIKLSSHLGIASKPFLHGEQSSSFHATPISKSFLHGEQSRSFHAIPILPSRRLLPSPPRASTNGPRQGLTGKPTFWWRILACIPYFLTFQAGACLFVSVARCIHPFLMGFGLCNRRPFLIFLPFLKAFGFCNCPFLTSLPRWLFSRWIFVLHCLGGLGVVERKEWPHFFRSHMLMSLELVLPFLIAAFVLCCWMKESLGLYRRKIGMHFLIYGAFVFMWLVLECMSCALCGMYPDVPSFVSFGGAGHTRD